MSTTSTNRFLVIHVWPEAIAPTIIPASYESYSEAESAARELAKAARQGHRYCAAYLPVEAAA